MKKIFKWLGVSAAVLVLVIVAAGIVLKLVVSREMVIAKLEKTLNRHVTIEAVDLGIFSLISGFEAREVRISNLKSPRELEALRNQAIESRDLFISIARLTVRFKILPLLFSRQLVLSRLTVQEPVIHLVQFANGNHNFSDLFGVGSAAAEPFRADDLPFALAVKKIAVEKGRIFYRSARDGQAFQFDQIEAQVQEIDIDPQRLGTSNSLKLVTDMVVKARGSASSLGYSSLNVRLKGRFQIRPFNPRTRLFDPMMDWVIESPLGSIEQIAILNKIRTHPVLTRFCGELDFLGDDLDWRDARVSVGIREERFTLADGGLTMPDYQVRFGGSRDLKSGALQLALEIVFNEKYSALIRSNLYQKASQLIRGDLAEYVSAETVRDLAWEKLTAGDDRVHLEFEVAGSVRNPLVTLKRPVLPTLEDLVIEMAGDLGKRLKKKLTSEIWKKLREKFNLR